METEPQLIDLREFFGVVRRRKWTVLLTVVVIMAAAGALLYERTPLYSSTVRVQVLPQFLGLGSSTFAPNMDNEAALVATAPIAQTVLGNPDATANQVSQLLKKVKVSVPAKTTFLDITYTDPSPIAAQSGAEKFASAYTAARLATANTVYSGETAPLTRQLTKAQADFAKANTALVTETNPAKQAALQGSLNLLNLQISDLQRQIAQFPTVSPIPAMPMIHALLLTTPSNKPYVSTLSLALILGLAVGVGLAFVRERLDERLGNHEQMEEASGAPVFAVIPKVESWRNREEARLVSMLAPDSLAAEAYRTARTSILYLAREGGLRVIEITGPGQHEGKTTTTVNLAVSLAQSGKKVIAVSCDLRRPRLHRFFGVDNAVGVTSVLRGQATLEQAMLQTEIKGLQIITSGPVPSNPAELLGSESMDQLLTVLRERADFILLDTTPALAVADALALAPKSDGVIIVADAAQTTRAAISRLRQQFEGVGATIIGGILNNLDPAHAKRYPGYDRYYYASYGRAPADGPQVQQRAWRTEPLPSGNGHIVPESTPVEKSDS